MFTIRFHSGGLLRKTFHDIPSYNHSNMWRIPDFGILAPSLAPGVRQALQRTEWKQEFSDVLRADLFDKKGKPIGSLFAHWKG